MKICSEKGEEDEKQGEEEEVKKNTMTTLNVGRVGK